MSNLKARYFLLPPCMRTACLRQQPISIGSRESQLIFPLLVAGLSLALSLAALVPIVLRDAHGWVPAGRARYFLSESTY